MYINKQSNIQKKDLVSTKTASGNPVILTDCAGGKARSLKTTIEPIQDLHGYDHPWAGGAGKNKLPLTVDGIKAANSGRGTWSGNSITIAGVTYTIITDTAGNVTAIDADGTSTSSGTYSEFWLIPNKSDNDYIGMVVNGSPTGYGSNCGILMSYFDGTTWKSEQINYNGRDSNISLTWPNILVSVVVKNNTTVNHVKFYPMIRLSTESDASFAPYANICPISGRTEARVDTENEDSSESAYAVIQLGTTVYGADINWDTGVMTVEWAIDTITGSKISGISNASTSDTAGGKRGTTTIISKYHNEDSVNIISDKLKTQTYMYSTTNPDTVGINDIGQIVVRYKGTNTLADMKTAFDADPVQVCYELAEHITLQLTPTQLQMLKGYNRVSIDNGSIELEYIPDNLAGDIISLVEEELEEINSNIGLGETVSASVANCLPPRFKDISNDYYNGNLKAEIAAGNFRNVRPGDYIIGSSTGSKYVVGACDYWYNKGDTACTTHHLRLMLVEVKNITQLWAGLPYDGGTGHWAGLNRCPWNAAVDVDPTSASAVGSNNTNISRTITISGTGTANPTTASASGYAGSFIRDRLIARLLPDCFVADFGSANVLLCRNLNGNAVITDKPSAAMPNWNGMTSGWAWMDSQIELPSEVELYGTMVFSSSAMDVGCQDQQLALFRNVSIEQVVGRTDVWTKAVASSASACLRYDLGDAANSYACCASCALPLANVK